MGAIDGVAGFVAASLDGGKVEAAPAGLLKLKPLKAGELVATEVAPDGLLKLKPLKAGALAATEVAPDGVLKLKPLKAATEVAAVGLPKAKLPRLVEPAAACAPIVDPLAVVEETGMPKDRSGVDATEVPAGLVSVKPVKRPGFLGAGSASPSTGETSAIWEGSNRRRGFAMLTPVKRKIV